MKKEQRYSQYKPWPAPGAFSQQTYGLKQYHQKVTVLAWMQVSKLIACKLFLHSILRLISVFSLKPLFPYWDIYMQGVDANSQNHESWGTFEEMWEYILPDILPAIW